MAFLLDGNILREGVPFEHAGVQYPANFLNLSTEAEKSAIGITWEADATRADDRFYWDGNISNPKALEDVLATDTEGNPVYVQVYNPETHSMDNTSEQMVTKGLKTNWIAQIKQTTNLLLAQSDWYVIRKAEKDVAIPTDIVTKRAAIITESNRLETAITSATTVTSLIEVLNTQNWPQ
jgi:hypothetical protein